MYQITKEKGRELKRVFDRIEKKYHKKEIIGDILEDVKSDIFDGLETAITKDARKVFNVQIWNEEGEIKLKIRPEIVVESAAPDPKITREYMKLFQFIESIAYVNIMRTLTQLLKENTPKSRTILARYFRIEEGEGNAG